jgi:uncharacterized small protein (DUF1192 family)
MMRTALAVLVLILTLVCCSGKPQPVFAKGRGDEIAKKYPDSRYIVRSGTGETPGGAADAARFEIAKYFGSRISGETLVQEWAKSESGRGKTRQSQMTEISNTIMVGASRDIPGIEIPVNEENKELKCFEAWAVVDKEKLSGDLMERIAAFDAEVDRRLALKEEKDLKRVAALAGCMRDLVSRELARQDLALLGRNASSRNSTLKTVMTSLDSLLTGAFDVALVFEGNADEKIKSVLLMGIVDAGIRVKEYPDAASAAASSDLTIAVSHRATKRKTSQTISGKEFTFHWSDWVLSVKSVDPATGEVIGTTVLNDRVNGGTEEQAYERMVTRILQAQVPKVTVWVYGTVFNPGKQK